MTKTQLKAIFKEMINTYKVKAEADYEMEIQVRYFKADETFTEIRLIKEGDEMDELTQEFDFEGSSIKSYNFAKEAEEFFKSLKLNTSYKKVCGI